MGRTLGGMRMPKFAMLPAGTPLQGLGKGVPGLGRAAAMSVKGMAAPDPAAGVAGAAGAGGGTTVMP